MGSEADAAANRRDRVSDLRRRAFAGRNNREPRRRPDRLAIPVRLSASKSPGNLTLLWPSYAVGFKLESSSTVGGAAVWSPVIGTPALNQGMWELTLPMPGNATHYRLKQ